MQPTCQLPNSFCIISYKIMKILMKGDVYKNAFMLNCVITFLGCYKLEINKVYFSDFHTSCRGFLKIPS